MLAMFGATIVWGTVQAYLPLFGKEALGLSGPAIGYLLAVQAVFNGLSRVPGGRIGYKRRATGAGCAGWMGGGRVW